ncbi:cytochrome c [Jhaorihella thermophila]|uniref:Cytochrome c, mono-and diheme variants n=1 Tax=Jhaorihella thermophila TaxID=488547 RepID=A0A1H5TY11_9RHOB|nr:cytochrome c [Jhaorihella thermophila]SEF67724.1 Cytochrome c, mono-and diheme variants [Jhaorihella thermophila]
MRLIRWLIAAALLTGAAFWWLTGPRPLPDDATADLVGDAGRGETVFWAAGCASCHAAPGAKGAARLVLAGGYRIESPFGTFVAPNISPSPQGIGGWSTQDLANALIAGVSPDGRHYYPALPYTTYTRMTLQDVANLKAYLDTLPPSDSPSAAHELGFPFNVRRGLGLWKRLNLSPDWVLEAGDDPQLRRGRYLVEALGHCAECHTPRDALGGLDVARWMQGAPNPSGKGRIPPLTPDKLTWSAADIAYYLETGFTPDYDSAGGEMAQVVENLAHLSAEDRLAIAAYLKALPGPAAD